MCVDTQEREANREREEAENDHKLTNRMLHMAASGGGRGRAGRYFGLLGDQRLGGESRPARDAAFRPAERVTLAGSTTPAASRSSYLLVAAL